MADKVACGDGERNVGGILDLIIALAQGVMADLGVDVASGAGHVARTHRFAAGGFEGFVNLAREIACGGIARVCLGIVIATIHRQCVGCATGQHDLFSGHAAGHLGQAHGFAGQARGIDRIADGQLGIVGHDLGCFGKRLFERVGGVIRTRGHGACCPPCHSDWQEAKTPRLGCGWGLAEQK